MSNGGKIVLPLDHHHGSFMKTLTPSTRHSNASILRFRPPMSWESCHDCINHEECEKAYLPIRSAVIQDRYIREEWRTTECTSVKNASHTCYHWSCDQEVADTCQ